MIHGKQQCMQPKVHPPGNVSECWYISCTLCCCSSQGLGMFMMDCSQQQCMLPKVQHPGTVSAIECVGTSAVHLIAVQQRVGMFVMVLENACCCLVQWLSGYSVQCSSQGLLGSHLGILPKCNRVAWGCGRYCDQC